MPCGYWSTHYRLDMDTAAACATPPPYGQAQDQNLAAFQQFRARNSNAARYNPAAEAVQSSPAAEKRSAPSGQVELLGGGGLSSDFSGLVAARGAERRAPPEDTFPMGITSDFSNLGSGGGGPASVQLLEPSSVSAQQGPPGGK